MEKSRGVKVRKRSGKPFKSGNKINTVKGEAINPYTEKPGYIFYEDNSIVNQEICWKVSEPSFLDKVIFKVFNFFTGK